MRYIHVTVVVRFAFIGLWKIIIIDTRIDWYVGFIVTLAIGHSGNTMASLADIPLWE